MKFLSVIAASCAIVFAGPVQAETQKAETQKVAEAAPSIAQAKTDHAAVLSQDIQKHALAEPAKDGGSAPVEVQPPAQATPQTSEPAKTEDAQKPAEKAAEAPKPAPPPEPTLTAKIDLGAQQMVVSENGDAKYTWAISSGTEEHPTPRGSFRAQWTAKMWYSKKYDNAPMPNAVFIHDGVAIHATYATGLLGRPASHGCIRLSPANAATFYRLVNKHGTKLTRVSVFGTPKWRSPAVARRDHDEPRRYVQREVAPPAKSWFWGGSTTYKTTSAFDLGFTKKAYRRPPPPPGYRYADEVRPRAYRSYDGQRVYYVQPQPRRYSSPY